MEVQVPQTTTGEEGEEVLPFSEEEAGEDHLKVSAEHFLIVVPKEVPVLLRMKEEEGEGEEVEGHQ